MSESSKRMDGNSAQTREARTADALDEGRNRLDLEFFQRREKQREAEAAKIARLRSLRLTKEAAEAEEKDKVRVSSSLSRAGAAPPGRNHGNW
jgi:hypothetical protein